MGGWRKKSPANCASDRPYESLMCVRTHMGGRTNDLSTLFSLHGLRASTADRGATSRWLFFLSFFLLSFFPSFIAQSFFSPPMKRQNSASSVQSRYLTWRERTVREREAHSHLQIVLSACVCACVCVCVRLNYRTILDKQEVLVKKASKFDTKSFNHEDATMGV